MGVAAVKHREIVKYTGSITDMHGLWSIDARYSDGRVDLRSPGGLKLRGVRPQSYTTVAVPRITARRADALKTLTTYPGYSLAADLRTWLIKVGLAEVEQTEYDTAPVFRVTKLGYELSGALPAWY